MIPTEQDKPVSPINTVGVYLHAVERKKLAAWETREFRNRSEVIREMTRVLSLAGWKPGEYVKIMRDDQPKKQKP